MPDWRPFMKHLRRPIVVLDTETTGLFNKHPWARVWDLAAVYVNEEGRTLSEFQAIIKIPDLDSRAAEAIAFSGMTVESLRALMDAEGDEQNMVVDRFRHWWLTCHDAENTPPVVTSYNAEFDRRGVELLGMTDLTWGPCIMKTTMAIMGPAGKLRNANPRHPNFNPRVPWLFTKQSLAAEYFGVPMHEPAHRAMADARTASGVWHAIRQHAEKEIAT